MSQTDLQKANTRKLPWKLFSAVVLFVAGVCAAVIVIVMDREGAAVNAAAIMAFVTAAVATIASLQIDEVDRTVNSRLGEWRAEQADLLAQTRLELTRALDRLDQNKRVADLTPDDVAIAKQLRDKDIRDVNKK